MASPTNQDGTRSKKGQKQTNNSTFVNCHVIKFKWQNLLKQEEERSKLKNFSAGHMSGQFSLIFS